MSINTVESSSEEWRDAFGFEGIYQVSNEGRVRRVLASRGTRPGIIKPQANPRNGYLTVSLSRENKKKRISVHRLVALAFLGPQPEGKEVCHNDDDRNNNHASNLRWDTHSQNHFDIARNGNRARVCSRGHEMTGDNLYISPSKGHRQCRKCKQLRDRGRKR